MAEFPKPGQVFGEYRILDVLGRGGMGVVFRAEHLRMSRQVALKVIAPDYSADPEFLARFQREAALQASLDSPHIVSVYDHGEIDGYPFIASQLITGGDLASFLKERGPLSRRDATELTLQVASALAAAHQAGIVHRDVKPSNVLLRPGTEVFVYLCDFGVAQVLDSELTKAGNIVGTYAYLAPERCEGGSATPASDQYALGCLFVAALTGQAPFRGSDIAVAQQHVSGPVPQIQAAQHTDVAINRLLARLLAKAPEQRFASTSEVAAELRRLRDDLSSPSLTSVGRGDTELRPVTPLPAPPLESTTLRPNTLDQPSVSRPPTSSVSDSRRATIALLAGVATLLVIALIVGVVLALRPNPSSPASASTRGSTTSSTTTAPSNSSAPSPEPSAATEATTSAKGGHPLPGMEDVPFENPTCNRKYIVIVKTAADSSEYGDKLERGEQEVISGDPPKYLENDQSCNGFAPTTTDADHNLIYNLYLGPYDTMDEACQARASLDPNNEDSPLAWVKQLVPHGNPSARLLCACTNPRGVSSLPTYRHGDAVNIKDVPARRRLIADAQYVLMVHLLNPSRALGGYFTQQLVDEVLQYQGMKQIPATGALDSVTWQSMMDDYCNNPRYPPRGSSTG